MLARGAETPILSDGDMGVVVHVYLKHSHENITNSKVIISDKKLLNWNNVSSSKKKAKMEQLGPDSVPELNTKTLGKSLSFLSVTRTTLFAQRFMSYKIFEYRLSC
jgi:hypothetical protein